jgi:hypothetical protein
MKKLISVIIFLFCFVLISAQNTGQGKTQVTTQKKVQVKTPVTTQKKVQGKTPVTIQKQGQVKTQATPQNKGQVISVPAPCKWQKNEADPFNGVSARMTNWEVAGYISSVNPAINNGLTGVYNFAVSENIEKKDTSYMLWIRTSTSQSLCFNKESKIMIKSGETILTINLTGATICGKNITSNGILDADTRKLLRSHAIEMLRIQFLGDGNTVINVDLKDAGTSAKLDSKYFINTLKCF